MLLRTGAVSEIRKNRKDQHNKGFTLSETLIVVAILLILLALVIPNLIKLQRTLRQKELDAKAEIIYMAAQERLVALHSSGNSYTEGPDMASASGGLYPSDMIVTYDDDGNQVHRAFKYITSVSPASSKTVVLPADVIDEELRSNNWVIEYDPTNDMVYAVYYSEKKQVQDDYPSSWSHFDTLRDKQERIKDGAWIGYYGGDAAAMGGEGSSFAPTITIINAEELTAKLQCNAFSGIKDMVFELTMKDESNHVYKQTFTSTEGQITQLGRSFVYEMTLDSLSENSKRFNVQYGALSGHLENEILIPGQKLTLELKAYSKNNAQFEPGTTTAETNSLFAMETVSGANPAGETDTGVAYIAYGRHLQNLDKSSGVTDTITKVKQMYDISFSDDPDNAKDWYSTYSKKFYNGLVAARETANFKPIFNDNIKEYDGDGKLIQSLCISVSGNVDGSGNAGLFKRMSDGMKINNVYLTAPYVKAANGSAGGFAGAVSGNGNEFNNAGVFLTRKDINDIEGNKDSYVWISGDNAGGLAGIMTGGSLSVSESFASTVISAEDCASGLIGYFTGGALDLDKSYADSYIYGDRTAGLVSTGGNANVDSVTNCYAAGFQTADSSEAGLVNGSIGSARNTYTIVAKKTDSDTAEFYSTANDIDSVSDVYFLTYGTNSNNDADGTQAIGSMSKSALSDRLGGAFETDTSDAFLYNLMGQALTGYDYPCLVVNRHYGDWVAKFQDGALVYYELYDDGSYGFYGANIRSTLKNSGTVVGDGYGLVYKGGSGIPTNVWVNGDRFDMSTRHKVTSGSTTYYIYPFNKGVVNTPTPSGKFYRKVTIRADGADDETYYYNPLFAKTVVHADTEPAEAPAEISIRTPRHLYNLSKHYDDRYRDITTDSTYKQERSINYSRYKWTSFTNEERRVAYQDPIGATPGRSFNAVYDGGRYTISNVSFKSTSGSYVGLFGYNTGTINNVAVAVNYNPDSDSYFYVQKSGNIGANQTIYLGVLAGYNAGSIYNCATAGYYIAGVDGTIHAYSNSNVYAGGLVGANEKTIRNSSADCPEIRLSSLYAKVAIGGFVGQNKGQGSITDSYSLGYLEVAESKGGTVTVGGFAGSNLGTIRNSYCATAISTSGTATSHGFSPHGGVVSGCSYLNQGTYSYIDKLYIYSFDNSVTTGTPVTYAELIRDASVKAAAKRTYYHPNTFDGESHAYPFRAVVTDYSGNPAHYGDWLVEAELGMRGVFYWEKEENGSNNGYHFTYLGVKEDGKEVTGTTLCNAHDDGGKITSFGYGFYTFGNPGLTVSTTGLDYNGKGSTNGTGGSDSTVAGEMNSQLPSYTFYPYVTETDNTGSYIRLAKEERRFGDITLNVSGLSSVKFSITPFFANAMQITEVGGNPVTGSVNMTAVDYRVTDFAELPGSWSSDSVNNVYEIRNVDQFEYINWNYQTGNCSTLVTGVKGGASGNYKEFPFLQYATLTTVGTQDRTLVEAKRPPQYWVQSHDLHGSSGDNITPIAGMATSTPVKKDSYENFLYAWFGGSYDGQNYKIQNIEINSPSFTVGLFGVTAGAEIKNVILFSNSDPVKQIKRDTEGTEYDNKTGAYTIGGLIAIAYEYKSTVITNKISNCAIAGYEIVDSSTNRQGCGTANVGGLIGLANVNLEKSSSVVDIIIDCMHPHGHAYYGSFVRVGGLAGSAGAPRINNTEVELAIKNCYTGGSITVTERCRDEGQYNGGVKRSDGYILRDSGGTGYINNIFAACIIGGSYAPNISNFTGITANQPDGVANIENCYTYMNLPDLEGNVRAVSLISSPGDRYCRDTKITVTNCWYLNSIADNIGRPHREDPSTWPDYYIYPGHDNNRPVASIVESEYSAALNGDETYRQKYEKLVISDTEFEKMLKGNLTCLRKYLNDQGSDNKNVPSESQFKIVDYDGLKSSAMPGRLDSNAWSKVTTVDYGGADVSGKYSFSSLDSQIGKDYPFPTVIKQKDLTYSTKTKTERVNVHYGRWPFDGWYWGKGRDSMDIFDDMKDGGYATKDFYLYYNSDRTPTFDFSEENMAEVVYPIQKDETNNRYIVTVKALKTGAVTITEHGTGASFVLDITSKLKLAADPDDLLLFKGKDKTLVLTAKSEIDETKNYSSGNTEDPWVLSSELSGAISWERIAGTKNQFKVTGLNSGIGTLKADFSYDYHGVTIGSTLSIPVRSLGYIGLYNNAPYSTGDIDRNKQYTGSWRWSDDETRLSGLSMPAGSELYIFGSAEDGDFGDYIVSKITVNGTEHEFSQNTKLSALSNTSLDIGDYTLKFKDIAESGSYSILPVYIRHTGGGTVSVQFDLEDPVTNTGLDPEAGEYILKADGDTDFGNTYKVAVPEYVVSFNPGADTDVSGTMYDVGISGSSYTVPECGFTRAGREFTYWTIGDGTTEYIPGSTISGISSDITLKAHWESNKYTIYFDNNTGEGSIPSITNVPYEGEGSTVTLPVNTGEDAPIKKEGFVFTGWNTAADGSGESYADGAEVSQLTTRDSITLYAQWRREGHTLSLRYEGAEYWSGTPQGNSLEGTNYETPGDTPGGWALAGWYTTDTMDGQMILDNNGFIADGAGDVEGITEDGSFKLAGDVTLYARWMKEAALPVTSLNKTDGSGNYVPENGNYLILSSNEAGKQNAMGTNGGNYPVSIDAEIIELDVFDEDGNTYQSYIADPDDRAVWELTYDSVSSTEFGGYFYWVMNVYNNDHNIANKYLRHGKNSPYRLELTDSVYWDVGKLSDRQDWGYENHKLRSRYSRDASSNHKYACLNGSTWTAEGDGNVYMYRIQTAYTFTPD